MIELHPGEKILLERRQHWLQIVLEGIAFVMVTLVPLVVFVFVELLPAPIPQTVARYLIPFFFVATAWLFVVWILFFVSLTNYYLDVLVVTNLRIIYIEQIGLFARELAELRLENVQDIKVEVVGFLASLMDFGNLHLQTAGEHKEFIVRNIPKPHATKDVIAKQCHLLATRV